MCKECDHREGNGEIQKLRNAIGDRALWFALLYREFSKIFPEKEVEEASRRAIYQYGRLKASRDERAYDAKGLMDNFQASGAAGVFDAVIEETSRGMINRVGNCALVDAWKALGCTAEEQDLFCDIAMEGDRGRADGHGIALELKETLGKGDDHCWIGLSGGGKHK